MVLESEKAVNIFQITWIKHSHHSFSSTAAAYVFLIIYVCIRASSLLVLVNLETDAMKLSRCETLIPHVSGVPCPPSIKS